MVLWKEAEGFSRSAAYFYFGTPIPFLTLIGGPVVGGTPGKGFVRTKNQQRRHCMYGSSPKRHLWEGVRVAVSRWRGSLRSLPPSETSDDLLSTLHCTSTSCWAPFILIKKSVRGIEPGRACKQLSAFPTTQKCVEASLMQKQCSELFFFFTTFPAQTV